MQTIVLINESGSKNLGDQAIMQAMIEALSSVGNVKSIPLTVSTGDERINLSRNFSSRAIYTWARRISRFVPEKLKARLLWYFCGGYSKKKRFLSEEFTGASMIVVGGGQLIKNNLALFCDHLALISRLARARRIPYMFFGVGVDRKMSFLSWRLTSTALMAAELISVRDRKSYTRLHKIFDSLPDCIVSPDVAFSLNRVNTWKNDRDVEIAINVMCTKALLRDHSGVERCSPAAIRDGWFFLAQTFSEKGVIPVVFTTGTNEDLIEAQILCDRLRSEAKISVRLVHPQSLDELLDFLTKTRSVFATRMHAGILSYIAGANSICMNWDDKVVGVWSMIGERRRVIGINDAAGKSGAARVASMLVEIEPPKKDVVEKLAQSVNEVITFGVTKLMHSNAH